MPAYKTIIMELILEQPALYEKLRSSKRLLPAIDDYATLLKASHEEWMEQLSHSRPGSDPRMIASEALEIASQELEERLASASKTDDTEPLSLDAAMTFLRNSPTA